MPNSIIDQIRKASEYADVPRDDLDPELRWVRDQNIKVHYYPALFEQDGIEHSFWPERFPLDFLNSIRHTRDFAKNYMNRPVSGEAGYWTEEDIEVTALPEGSLKTILVCDPAVTTRKASDYTGLAVLSKAQDGKVYVRHASQVKVASETLRDTVSDLCEQYDARVVLVESNQGGDLWKQVFNGIPARLRLRRAGTDSKEIRAGRAFDFYKKNKVFHTGHFALLEEQMYNFPKVKHDDIVDAVTSGVLYFLGGNKAGPITATQYNYIGDN
jgi:phage terminase large subunit-like protein